MSTKQTNYSLNHNQTNQTLWQLYYLSTRVGPDLERTLGARRIIPIYLIAGIGSNIASTIFVPKQVTGGASGALFGLYGLLLVDLKRNWKAIISPMKDLVYIIITILISCALGILPGICNFAHLGGFVFGILAGIVFVPSSQELANENRQEKAKISKVFIHYLHRLLSLWHSTTPFASTFFI